MGDALRQAGVAATIEERGVYANQVVERSPFTGAKVIARLSSSVMPTDTNPVVAVRDKPMRATPPLPNPALLAVTDAETNAAAETETPAKTSTQSVNTLAAVSAACQPPEPPAEPWPQSASSKAVVEQAPVLRLLPGSLRANLERLSGMSDWDLVWDVTANAEEVDWQIDKTYTLEADGSDIALLEGEVLGPYGHRLSARLYGRSKTIKIVER